MRAVVQRVTEASVNVESECFCEKIGRGFAVLLGIGVSDRRTDCEYIARKITGLRVFEDEGGKMNRSLTDIGGQVLLVSQFTLYADCRRGRRPSFTAAAPPEAAASMYEHVCGLIRENDVAVKCGLFQKHMQVTIVNDGPVTILLDSGKKF